MRSILSVHNNETERALYWIEKCREFLDGKFTSMIVDDYDNMYPLSIKAQQLVELEEILLWKDAKLHGDSDKCQRLEKMWKQRLNFVQHSVEVCRLCFVPKHADHGVHGGHDLFVFSKTSLNFLKFVHSKPEKLTI